METETLTPSLATADLSALSDDELEQGLCSFAARLAAATYVFVSAIAEYDRRQAWKDWGCTSMVHWLGWKCAMGPVAAREHVRVGAALGDLPVIRGLFASGSLTYSQVRALTRVATPATDEDLAVWARSMTAGQLEKVLRSYRRARAEIIDPGRAPWARRTLRWRTDDDGSMVATVGLAAEDAAVVITALAAATGRLAAAGEACGDRDDGSGDPTLDRHGASKADALVEVARVYLSSVERSAAHSDGSGGDGDDGDGEAGSDERYLVTVVAEQRVLEGSTGAPVEGSASSTTAPAWQRRRSGASHATSRL